MTESLPPFPPGYVLPDLDADSIKKMLNSIKDELGHVELNFQTADFSKLRTALRSLKGQVQVGGGRGQGNARTGIVVALCCFLRVVKGNRPIIIHED